MNIKRLFILTGTVLLGLTLVSIWMLFLSAPPETARAASYTVCLAGPPTCDYSSIQDAVDAATNGDTILVTAGSYSENIIISETLTLEGEGVNNTIVNGSQAIEVFSIESSGTVTITGMTIKKGGKTNVENHGKLTIDESIISDNVGGGCFPCSGGGIWNDGTLTVTNSIVDSNSAWFGGGILNMDIGVVTLINSSISNNSGDGGGIFNRGMLILNDCVVNDNNGVGFEEIWSEGTITLTNTTLSSNTGRGITISSGNVSLNNVTLSGGGISASSGLVSIQNSIIPSCSANEGVIVSNGYNLVGVVDGCNWVDAAGDITGTLAAPLDPVIGPLQDNGGPTLTHALLPESPAIDSGSCPDYTADQRGYLRPVDILAISDVDDGCDIGAFEIQNLPPTINGAQSGQTVDDNATIDPFAGVTISDADEDTLKVIISLDNITKGELSNLGGFVKSPTGTYTYEGSPSFASTAIQGLTFNPTKNRKTPGNTDTTTFTISADDGIADPVADDTTTVIATSINDPPTIEGTVAGQTVNDDSTIDSFTGVTITDPDKDATLTVIVSLDDPDKGTLTNLGSFVEGPDGTYTFMGSPAASTTVLRGLTFVPTAGRVPVGQTETTTFTISADDGIADPVIDDATTVIVSPAGTTKKIFLPLVMR